MVYTRLKSSVGLLLCGSSGNSCLLASSSFQTIVPWHKDFSPVFRASSTVSFSPASRWPLWLPVFIGHLWLHWAHSQVLRLRMWTSSGTLPHRMSPGRYTGGPEGKVRSAQDRGNLRCLCHIQGLPWLPSIHHLHLPYHWGYEVEHCMSLVLRYLFTSEHCWNQEVSFS